MNEQRSKDYRIVVFSTSGKPEQTLLTSEIASEYDSVSVYSDYGEFQSYLMDATNVIAVVDMDLLSDEDFLLLYQDSHNKGYVVICNNEDIEKYAMFIVRVNVVKVVRPYEPEELWSAVGLLVDKMDYHYSESRIAHEQLQKLKVSHNRLLEVFHQLEKIRAKELDCTLTGGTGEFVDYAIVNIKDITDSDLGILITSDKDCDSTYVEYTEDASSLYKLFDNKSKYGNVVVIDKLDSVDEFNSIPSLGGEYSHAICVPLALSADSRGILFFARTDKTGLYSEHDKVIVELIAAEVELLAERIQLLNTLKNEQQQLINERKEQQKLIEKLSEAQEQLLQSEKMASIGQLAAGVAHEINNPVGFIKSNISTLESYIKDLMGLVELYEGTEGALGEETRKVLLDAKNELDIEFLREDIGNLIAESSDGIQRVKKIVQDLKDFSHMGKSKWQESDIHAGLDSTLNIVRNEIKYNSTIEKEYGELPFINCNISQLNQVFMNMLVNASHAIDKNGVIKIQTGTEDNGWVWIKISDNGKGIAKEQLKKIFDPFFTTKPVGKGTGLGLSISYRIVKEHGGEIVVDSEPGKGTSFTIRLPVDYVPEQTQEDTMLKQAI